MDNYEELLEDYRSLWNNRLLQSEGQDCSQILNEAIKRDILDENSHPRIRRSKQEKFYLATKRILESTIKDNSKLILIDLHKKIMEEL